MIKLNNKTINNLNAFDAEFQVVLGLISGGEDYLKWALTEPSTFLDVTSQKDFLREIQTGLNDSETLNIGQVRMGLQKVFTLSQKDIGTLLNGAVEGNEVPNEKAQLLIQQGLVSFTQLKLHKELLTENNLENEPLFQALDFNDQLSLCDLRKLLCNAPAKLRMECLNFALPLAGTVEQFCNLAMFYWNCVQNQLKNKDNPIQRKAKIQEIYQALEPLTNFLIYVPNIGRISENELLQKRLTTFVSTFPSFYGYKTKAEAISNLVQNVKVLGADEKQIRKDIDDYLLRVKRAITSSEIPAPTTAQDGKTRFFTLESEGYKIVLRVDEAGNLALGSKTQIIVT